MAGLGEPLDLPSAPRPLVGRHGPLEEGVDDRRVRRGDVLTFTNELLAGSDVLGILD